MDMEMILIGFGFLALFVAVMAAFHGGKAPKRVKGKKYKYKLFNSGGPWGHCAPSTRKPFEFSE